MHDISRILVGILSEFLKIHSISIWLISHFNALDMDLINFEHLFFPGAIEFVGMIRYTDDDG